jgi:alkylation response protein AidB-like acyl-CoA dehydrogenase
MSTPITFAVSEEQALLRDTARKLLAARSPSEKVREDMATPEGFDASLWAEIAQMGWQAMAVPEEHGGAGYGWTEVAVLAEEMGAALVCAPYLSSAVLAVATLRAAGDADAAAEHLPGIAAGEIRATLAHVTEANDLTLDDGRLVGTVTHVLDGHTADVVIVPVRDGEGWSLYTVAGDAEGLTRAPMDALDQTRRLATLTFDGVTATPLGTPGAGGDVLEHARTVGAVVVANEQVGGAQRVLEMSTAYAKERYQFGRAIGSFQAIKHRLAEMLVEVETAKSVAYHAARALDAGDADEVAIAAPMAASYCGEVYEHAAGDAIQIHGGTGFTWEHDAHLYFKRAKSSKLVFGGPVAWRRSLADSLGL